MIEKSDLAAKVVQTAKEAFGSEKLGELLRGEWAPATAAIKGVFDDLGLKLGYRTAGSGRASADPQWKYDLIWFAGDRDGYTTRLPLILESELKPKGKTVDLDYVKLVAGRADVRVWLSCAANADDAKAHIEKCEEQSRRFAGSLPGDTYVFIIFEWVTRSVMIKTRVI